MGNYFHTKNMKIFSLGLATLATAQQWTYFDENVPCDQFNQKFEKIKGMTAKCSANKGPIKKKWRCHLKCSNGNPNVFSVKPIKCKSKGGVPKWRPSKIKDPEALCDDKDRCDGLKSQYNVSNKLLTWEKSRVSERQVRYDFACKDWTNKDNGKVFEMTPYPEDFATCTCNYNKPSNIRCKWSKIKKSIVRCVRADRPKGQSDDYYYEDMYQYDY